MEGEKALRLALLFLCYFFLGFSQGFCRSFFRMAMDNGFKLKGEKRKKDPAEDSPQHRDRDQPAREKTFKQTKAHTQTANTLLPNRNGQVRPRLRGRNGLRVHQPQSPPLQRPNLPREQDGRRQSRRGPRPHQPGLLHRQALRGHPGRLLQGGRQVLHRPREAAAPRQVPAQAQAPARCAQA